YSSHCHRQLSYLHCCPTRRSSDLMDNLESMAEQAPQELALISQDQLSRLLDNVGSELVSYGATLVSLSGVAGVVSLLVFLVLIPDRKSTRLNSSHVSISYAVFCLK